MCLLRANIARCREGNRVACVPRLEVEEAISFKEEEEEEELRSCNRKIISAK